MRRRVCSFSWGSLAAAFTTGVAGNDAAADKQYGPGVTDTEIKIGQTRPYSGPASSFGTTGRTAAAYYKMMNERGGVNGRKINFLSLDNEYSPAKIGRTRAPPGRTGQGPWHLPGSLGTAPNVAIQRYLNELKVPQFFVFSGAARFRDPKNAPRWTIGGDLAFLNETQAFARYILQVKPEREDWSTCIRTTISRSGIHRNRPADSTR